MTTLLSNNYVVHASSFHSAHLYTPNVCDSNVYKAQMCTSFYYLIVNLLLSAQDNDAVEEL